MQCRHSLHAGTLWLVTFSKYHPDSFPIRHPVGALGFSNLLSSSRISTSKFTVNSLVGLQVLPPNVQCWSLWAWAFGRACTRRICSRSQIEGADSHSCLVIKSRCSVQLAIPYIAYKVAKAIAYIRSTFDVRTCLCSFGVRSCLPHNSYADLSGTGCVLSCHPSSAHLDMAKVSHGGAAPVAATLPPFTWSQKQMLLRGRYRALVHARCQQHRLLA